MFERRFTYLLVALALVAFACSESTSDDGSAADSADSADGTAADSAEGDASAGNGAAADGAAAADADADAAAPEPTEVSETTTGPTETPDEPAAPEIDPDSVVGQFAGETWLFGTVPNAPLPADPDAEPIKIGMINQENTPLGSFPEMRGAVEAGVAFVNAELGGVGGRPLELLSCVTSFDPTMSQSCAQEMVQAGVVALVGGIDVTSTGSLPVLESNGIPQLGGIPANLDEQRSDHMFFFSGGVSGGVAAMMAHAQREGATKAFIAYGEFDSFAVAARDYGAAVAEDLGLEVVLAPFPLINPDFLPVLTAAADSGAQAVVILAADTACAGVVPIFPELVPDAQLYMTGACAADAIADSLGEDLDILIMNSEGPNEPTVEGDIYQAVIDRHAVNPAGGAGTVAFRGFMNLYDVLVELGPEEATSAGVIDVMRSAENRPSYWGHEYTCDGNQVPGLPALCAPQQTLFRLIDGETIDVGGGWIDTVGLLASAVG